MQHSGSKNGKIFRSVEELLQAVLDKLIDRVDIKTIKARSRRIKAQKMQTNLQLMSDELTEHNNVKVVARSQNLARLDQTLNMAIRHAHMMMDKGIWDLRRDHIKWQLKQLKGVKNARGKTLEDYHRMIFQNV